MFFSNISKKSEQLAHTIDFIPLEIYASFVKKVSEIFDKTSQKKYESFMKDSDFYALALYADSPIWTNDKLFKEQDEIVVFTTKEVIKLCRHLI